MFEHVNHNFKPRLCSVL